MDRFASISIPHIRADTIASGCPTLLERVGGYLLSVSLLTFIGFAAFFQTPERLIVPVAISSSPEVGFTQAPRDGRVVRLTAGIGAEVRAGDVIALLENDEDFDAISALKTTHAQLGIDSLFPVMMKPRGRLGPLQKPYTDMVEAALLLARMRKGEDFQLKRITLKNQIAERNRIAALLEDTGRLVAEKLALLENEATIRRGLWKDGVGSRLSVQAIESQVLDQRATIIETKRQHAVNALEQQRLAEAIAALSSTHALDLENAGRAYSRAIAAMQTAIDAWERRNLLKAPTSGTLLVVGARQEQQLVNEGDVLFAIVPTAQHIQANGTFEGSGFGQVKVGNKVLISLADYPARRFGKIEGFVDDVSKVVVEGRQQVWITLTPKAGETTPILYRHGMAGSAEIITKPQSLLKRLWQAVVGVYE